jgi:hypothetical protein
VSILVLGASGSCARFSRMGQCSRRHRTKPPAYPDATVLPEGPCDDECLQACPRCNPLHHLSSEFAPLWNAWPTHLERLLRTCWDNERVHVRNRCDDYPGSGTSMFVGLAASSPQAFDADIVLLETANNDLPEDTPAFREQALAVNEILARQLQELPSPRQPFLMWLETSWRGEPNPNPSPSPSPNPNLSANPNQVPAKDSTSPESKRSCRCCEPTD